MQNLRRGSPQASLYLGEYGEKKKGGRGGGGREKRRRKGKRERKQGF